MLAMNALTGWLGAYSILVVAGLMALALGWRIPKHKPVVVPNQGVRPWFGIISFLLGWMVIFHRIAIPKHLMSRPNVPSDYFLDVYAKLEVISATACWLVGIFCGCATCGHLRGKMAILLNVVMLALCAFSVYAAMTATY